MYDNIPFHSFRSYFRVYLSRDIIGVQINGTMKNVLAIAAGLTEGLNLGENARAAILARGIKEIVRLIQAAGGKKIRYWDYLV